MEFTYKGYARLLDLLGGCGYRDCTYDDWREQERCVILRHDIDFDPRKAVPMAELEREHGVRSTYFVLLTSDFYNVCSKENEACLRRILDSGHEIGLHFDEVRYEAATDPAQVVERIAREAEVLAAIIGRPVACVSMHRPSRMVLEGDLQIPGIVNSYGQAFFKGFKYVSDSRRRWREPVEDIVRSGAYPRLHILTHAFWYNEKEEDIHASVSAFVNRGNRDRYAVMRDNITDLDSIMREEEIR